MVASMLEGLACPSFIGDETVDSIHSSMDASLAPTSIRTGVSPSGSMLNLREASRLIKPGSAESSWPMNWSYAARRFNAHCSWACRAESCCFASASSICAGTSSEAEQMSSPLRTNNHPGSRPTDFWKKHRICRVYRPPGGECWTFWYTPRLDCGVEQSGSSSGS